MGCGRAFLMETWQVVDSDIDTMCCLVPSCTFDQKNLLLSAPKISRSPHVQFGGDEERLTYSGNNKGRFLKVGQQQSPSQRNMSCTRMIMRAHSRRNPLPFNRNTFVICPNVPQVIPSITHINQAAPQYYWQFPPSINA